MRTLKSFFPKNFFLKKTGLLENAVKAQVMAYLDSRGDVYWWRQNSIAGKMASGAYAHAEKGVSDILCVKAGRMFAFELKREIGGELSEDQKRFKANVEAAGGSFTEVHSVDAVAAALGEIGPRIPHFKKVKKYRK